MIVLEFLKEKPLYGDDDKSWWVGPGWYVVAVEDALIMAFDGEDWYALGFPNARSLEPTGVETVAHAIGLAGYVGHINNGLRQIRDERIGMLRQRILEDNKELNVLEAQCLT